MSQEQVGIAGRAVSPPPEQAAPRTPAGCGVRASGVCLVGAHPSPDWPFLLNFGAGCGRHENRIGFEDLMSFLRLRTPRACHFLLPRVSWTSALHRPPLVLSAFASCLPVCVFVPLCGVMALRAVAGARVRAGAQRRAGPAGSAVSAVFDPQRFDAELARSRCPSRRKRARGGLSVARPAFPELPGARAPAAVRLVTDPATSAVGAVAPSLLSPAVSGLAAEFEVEMRNREAHPAVEAWHAQPWEPLDGDCSD